MRQVQISTHQLNCALQRQPLKVHGPSSNFPPTQNFGPFALSMEESERVLKAGYSKSKRNKNMNATKLISWFTENLLRNLNAILCPKNRRNETAPCLQNYIFQR